MNHDKQQLIQKAEAIYHAWEKALESNDVEKLVSLYTSDCVLESPLIPHILKTDKGICEGHQALRAFIEKVIPRKPTIRRFYQQNLFTDGKILMFEYPRQTPAGEQMDFMEVMEIKDGLIHSHRVYWGWRGVKVLQDDAYSQ